MSIVTLIGSGQMASALSFPLFENGHEVRLVGSPLDDSIINRLREDRYHTTLRRTLHDGVKYYKINDVEEAMKGSDWWFAEYPALVWTGSRKTSCRLFLKKSR